MSIDVAIKTGNAEAGVFVFAIVGAVEFFLRKRRDKHPQAVELHRRDDVFEQAVKIAERYDLAIGDVPELRAVLQEDGGGKFGDEGFWQSEINTEALQARELLDLHLRE